MAIQRNIGLIIVVVVAGLVVGSLLGEILGHLLPVGRVRDFLIRGPVIGLTPPATLDLRLMSLTLGFAFKVNVVGILGVAISVFTLRRV